MDDLLAGDRISVTFDDMPRDELTATVIRNLSDTEEGLGPEIEDYVARWIEIRRDGDIRPTIHNLLLLTSGGYLLDGRSVTVRRIRGSSSWE